MKAKKFTTHNLPPNAILPEVLGIDDCDYLFSCSSRDGEESLYARVQEFEWEGRTYYATKLTFDGVRNTQNESFPSCASNFSQVANWLIESARERWGRGLFCQCSDTRKHRTI